MTQDRREALRALERDRKLAGLQWAAICTRASVPYSTVWRALGEGRLPHKRTLERLTAAFEELVAERRHNLRKVTRNGKASRK